MVSRLSMSVVVICGDGHQDGLIWREMLARRGEKGRAMAWQGDAAGRMAGLQPRRRIASSPREKYLFMTHSAPERMVSRLLE